MNNKKIDTIVFDLGNVLVDFCWRKLFTKMGLEGDEFERLARATVHNVDWDLNDQGVFEDDELVAVFTENDPSMEDRIIELVDRLEECIEPFDYSDKWIDDLMKAGYKVYILSNFSHKAYYDCGAKLDFVRKTDGAILSFEDKLIKPDSAIYSLLFSRYNINPENAVFIDDREVNIEAAVKMGMNGIVFKNRPQVVEELRQLGVLTD